MGEKETKSSGLLKSTLIVFLPLITAILTANYQYVITRWENSDKNFRLVVSELTSKDKNIRHSAAASIGTYVKQEDRYLNETIDILTNRLSTETNHNVRNSIIGSLTKIKDQPEYRQVINRMLAIDRNNFVQDYQMKVKRDTGAADFDQAVENLKQAELEFGNSEKITDQFMLANLQSQAGQKYQEHQVLQQDYRELQNSIPMVSNMIAIFLSEARGREIVGLDFFRNNMNNIVATDLRLRETRIKWATFSSSTLSENQFLQSTIGRSFFSNSDIKDSQFKGSNISTSMFNDSTLINVDFSECNLKDVFFIGSDLAGASFSRAQGLEPAFFYEAINIDLARFDDPGFIDKVRAVSHDEFVEFVHNSTLNLDMKNYLTQ